MMAYRRGNSAAGRRRVWACWGSRRWILAGRGASGDLCARVGPGAVLVAWRHLCAFAARVAAASGARAGGRYGEPAGRRYCRDAALRHRCGASLVSSVLISGQRRRRDAGAVVALDAAGGGAAAAAAAGASICAARIESTTRGLARGGGAIERISRRDVCRARAKCRRRRPSGSRRSASDAWAKRYLARVLRQQWSPIATGSLAGILGHAVTAGKLHLGRMVCAARDD